MAYTTINKHTDYFNTLLYTGTGSGGSNRQLTGVGFQPDWTWIKNRDSGQEHVLVDAVRGATKSLDSSSNSAESTTSTQVGAFISDGFQLGSGSVQNRVNGNGNGLVAWNWKAGTGQGSSNTDGSINTTYTSVNTTAGFSISKYTGTGSNATVGHGLGVAPKIVIIKKTSGADDWKVYHASVGATKSLVLQGTNAETSDSTSFNSTAPTTSVFSVGTSSATNTSGQTYIAYCFAEKTGYSKFGSYTGNGNADGAFVYTGFKPSWLMIKRTNSTENWHIFDIKRNPYYPTSSSYGGMATRLMANLNSADDLSQGGFEFLSNGLKMTTSWSGGNGSGDTFIYMCFGQSLVGSNNVPCTAR